MNLTHTPATPLPWKPSLNDGSEQDASYLTHAANAYPKLVEALCELVTKERAEYAAAEKLQDSAYDDDLRAIMKVEALLRSLGETA